MSSVAANVLASDSCQRGRHVYRDAAYRFNVVDALPPEPTDR